MKLLRNLTLLITLLVIKISCSAEFAFVDDDNTISSGGSEDSRPLGSGEIAKKVFNFNDNPTPIDYLFVLDNSVSMLPIIKRIRSGLIKAASMEEFPKSSYFAVMSTMIGDDDNLSTTGRGINRYPGIDYEPGFLDFVDKESIQLYRQMVPQFAHLWPLKGCEQQWFSPGELNEQGVPCFAAALQSTASRVGAEAGALAFKQLLEKHKDKPLFREDALLNVIFISDTHDPGRPDPVLLERTPTFEELNSLVEEYENVEKLRFHALAPEVPCTSEDVHNLSYYKLVDASGGAKQDPCTDQNYQNFVQNMIRTSQHRPAVFKLSPPARAILAIRINDQLFNDFELEEDGRLLRLGVDPDFKLELVEVTYETLD